MEKRLYQIGNRKHKYSFCWHKSVNGSSNLFVRVPSLTDSVMKL